MCPDQLSCLQDIDLQLQTLTPATTTAAVAVSSGTWATSAAASFQSTNLFALLVGLALGYAFTKGLTWK